jgi:hypothetical protein
MVTSFLFSNTVRTSSTTSPYCPRFSRDYINNGILVRLFGVFLVLSGLSGTKEKSYTDV